jgi:uncharacterized protein YbcI
LSNQEPHRDQSAQSISPDYTTFPQEVNGQLEEACDGDTIRCRRMTRQSQTSVMPSSAGYRVSEPKAGSRRKNEVVVKTQGEIEAAICEGIARFEQEYMGRGPKDIHAHLIGDLLIVRLCGVLTAAEQHLVKTLPAEKGRDLLKQVRTHLIETARPAMEAMVHGTTGVKPSSLHHDISTVTGEEIVIFTLAESPLFREIKRK